MFCPQCGQQQVSEQVRFCPRCGFQLQAAAGLLATGGVHVQLPPAHGADASSSPRRRGLRQGALLMFIGMIVTPLLAVSLGPPHGPFGMPHALIPISAIIFFWGGILRMLYALFFQEGPIRKLKSTAQPTSAEWAQMGPPNYAAGLSPNEPAYLPPARENIPARGFAARDGRTAEVAAPPSSVTDHTTRLLRDTPEEGMR